MKTVLEDLQDWVNNGYPLDDETATAIVEKIEQMKAREKDMIELAWMDGKTNDDYGDNLWDDANNYFKKKFGSV